ncbi:MAG: prephenate dehydrogenase [Lachnospiraceae bacterium]|nr:prephenate dehydrogenase [Lachnospiraceae bacterium]
MGATMDKILIVGLGLIGGSYAKGLTKKGYEVYAYNRNKDAIDYAKEHGIIIDGTNEYSKNFICNFDRIIFSLYPKIFKEYIENFGSYIKDGAIISDVTGVKESIVADIQNVLGDRVEFIAAHPMAGKEVYGIENADEKIFENANYIITPTEKNTDKGIAFATEIGKALNFRKISVLSPTEHDEMIAFLSQLTHCIAVSLMTCKDSKDLVDYTGDSFRDLTRIANINENMWTELFLMNKTALLREMDSFIDNMSKLRGLVADEKVEEMKDMMRLSTKRRNYFNN